MQPFTHNANTFSQLTSKVNHVSQTTHKHTPTHKTHCNTSGLNTHVCIHYIYRSQTTTIYTRRVPKTLLLWKIQTSNLGGSPRHNTYAKYKTFPKHFEETCYDPKPNNSSRITLSTLENTNCGVAAAI